MSLKNQDSPASEGQLSPLKQKFWPVYSHEFKKIIPMILMMFGALFSYTLVRNVKDALLVKALHSSASALSCAKLFVVTPASILFVIFYAKLSNVLSRKKLFFSVLGFFGVFFLLFAFFLYPLNSLLNASPENILYFQQNFPKLKDFITIGGYWLYTLFYMMAELMGNVAVGVLFWQFANQVTPTEQAKRFYPLFGLWSNIALIVAGALVKYSPIISDVLVSWIGGSSQTLQIQFVCLMSVVGCLVMAGAYKWMNTHVIDTDNYDASSGSSGKKKKSKPKLSLKESFSILVRSPYLGFITIIVLSYGITINLMEISWKDAMRMYFPTQSEYLSFNGNQYIYTGVITMVMIMLCQNLVRVLGWRLGAIMTPLVTLVMGGLFFSFLVFKQPLGVFFGFSDHTILGLAVYFGLMCGCLIKAAKYAFLDPTKEMAYIPLDEEYKVKGKAAIDIIGGRAGKSGGSLLNMSYAMFFPAMSSFYMAAGLSVMGIGFIWIWAVNGLARLYAQKVSEKEAASDH